MSAGNCVLSRPHPHGAPNKICAVSSFPACHVSPTHAMSKKVTARSWWREHFQDHPAAADRLPEAYVKSDTGSTTALKVYCKECLRVDIVKITQEDLYAVTQGRIAAVRDD